MEISSEGHTVNPVDVDETCSSPQHQSSLTQHNSEKHYKSSETQSFTVEIKLKVEKERKETLSETKADTQDGVVNEEHRSLTETSNVKPVDDDKDDWISSDDEDRQKSLKKVSTLREKDQVEKNKTSRRPKMNKENYRRDEHYRSDNRYRSPSPSRYRRYKSPENRRSYSRDRGEKRSRRRYVTPDRSRRTSYRDDRRSRSRSRERRDYTPDRYRRSYSRDREPRRSRSRTRYRRDYTPDRYRRSYSRDRDPTRSRSQSPAKRDDDHRSPRTNWIADQLKSIRDNIQRDNSAGSRNCSTADNRLESNEKSSPSSDDTSNVSTEIDNIQKSTTVADQEAQEIFSRNSTIDMLRSRIQSSLSKVFSKQLNTTSSTVTSTESGQRMQSVWINENGTKTSMTHNASMENSSSQSIAVDDSIVRTIVSREISSNRMHSKSDVNMATDKNIQTHHNLQPPFQPTESLNGQMPNQIRDPRIQRILNSQIPSQMNSLQVQPYGTLTTHNVLQNNPATTRIYNAFTTLGSSSNPTNNALLPITAMSCLTPSSITPFQSQNTNQQFGNSRSRDTGSKPAPMTYGEYKRLQSVSSNTKATTIVKPMPIRKSMQKKPLHRATFPKRVPENLAVRKSEDSLNAEENMKPEMSVMLYEGHKADKTPMSTTMPKKSDVRVTQTNVNATRTANDESESALNTLRELINPAQLLTLVDLMEQMTENNSLVKVKEALEICANDTDISRSNRCATNAISTSADFRSKDQARGPKKKSKNELDRLHEDIDNMFIRDGVLSANGRRRNCSKATEQALENYFHIDSGQLNIPDPPRTSTSTISSVSNVKHEFSLILPKKIRVSSLQTPNHNRKRSSQAITDDADWLPNKRTPMVVLKKLPPTTNIHLVRKITPATQKTRIKNNNKELHSLKKIVSCQMCDDPPGNSLISHYINNHPECEVLTSRLAPEAAQFLRSLTPTDIVTVQHGIFKMFCYFCNVYRTYSKSLWKDHLIRHTGYFHFHCIHCSRKFASRPVNHTCGVGRYTIRKTKVTIFQEERIKAYVCELCNYVRLFEPEMESHLRNEHEDGEAKAYKEFTIMTLPKGKKGRPPIFKNKPESESEFNMESVFEEMYEFEVQSAMPKKECNQHSVEESPTVEDYDFQDLTAKLEKICNDASGNGRVFEENYESIDAKNETANEDDWETLNSESD